MNDQKSEKRVERSLWIRPGFDRWAAMPDVEAKGAEEKRVMQGPCLRVKEKESIRRTRCLEQGGVESLVNG